MNQPREEKPRRGPSRLLQENEETGQGLPSVAGPHTHLRAMSQVVLYLSNTSGNKPFELRAVKETKEWPVCVPLDDLPSMFEVEQAIRGMVNRKAVGLDELPFGLHPILSRPRQSVLSTVLRHHHDHMAVGNGATTTKRRVDQDTAQKQSAGTTDASPLWRTPAKYCSSWSQPDCTITVNERVFVRRSSASSDQTIQSSTCSWIEALTGLRRRSQPRFTPAHRSPETCDSVCQNYCGRCSSNSECPARCLRPFAGFRTA